MNAKMEDEAQLNLGIQKLNTAVIGSSKAKISESVSELVNLIQKEDAPDEEVLERFAELFVNEDDVDMGIAFRAICDEVGKLDVLPLINEIVSYESYQPLMDPLESIVTKEFCERMIATASSSIRHLTYVVEICLSSLRIHEDLEMTSSYRHLCQAVAHSIPSLLKSMQELYKAPGFDKLLSVTLELICGITEQACIADKVYLMIKSGVLLKLSVLISLLFSSYPSSTESIDVYEVLSMFIGIIEDCFEYHDSFQKDYLQITQMLIPVIAGIIPNEFENLEALINFDFLYNSSNFFKQFLKFTDPLILRKNMNLLINSEVMKNWVLLFNKTSPENCCGFISPCDLDECPIMNVIKDFIKTAGLEIDLPIESEIKLLTIFQTIFENVRAFEDGGLDVIHVDAMQTIILQTSYSIKSSDVEYRRIFCDPKDNILSSMMSFISSYPEYLIIVGITFYTIIKDADYKVNDILGSILQLPSLCLQTMDNPKYNKFFAKTNRPDLFAKDPKHALLMVPFMLLRHIAEFCNITQIMKIEESYPIKDLMLKILKKNKNVEVVISLVDSFEHLLKRHKLNFLNTDEVQRVLSVVIQKIKLSEKVENKVIDFIYTAALYLSSPTILERCELVPYILTDSKSLMLVKPHHPGLLKLLWDATTQHTNKALFKTLTDLSITTEVEFSVPGRVKEAKIYRLLSILIIEYLKNDPPFKVDYLVDLTQCMIAIAKSCTLDEEEYFLEDMVCPILSLFEKQDDERIIANVKEFIRILH